MQKPAPLFLGNWKMNLGPPEAREFLRVFLENFDGNSARPDCGIAPPFISIDAIRQSVPKNSGVLVGAQNVHWSESGAHTGEVSPQMLLAHGVEFAIIGHSERRQMYGENDTHVAQRARYATEQGLFGVICIGESKDQYAMGRTMEVIQQQLRSAISELPQQHATRMSIAYEPVWAIGTGLAATPEHAKKVHAMIRGELNTRFGASIGEGVRILYGGSTTPSNISELMAQPNVNGALVGGASLKPDIFTQLIRAGRQGYGNA